MHYFDNYSGDIEKILEFNKHIHEKNIIDETAENIEKISTALVDSVNNSPHSDENIALIDNDSESMVHVPLIPISLTLESYSRLMTPIFNLINGEIGSFIEIIYSEESKTIIELLFFEVDEDGKYISIIRNPFEYSINYEDLLDREKTFAYLKELAHNSMKKDIIFVRFIEKRIIESILNESDKPTKINAVNEGSENLQREKSKVGYSHLNYFNNISSLISILFRAIDKKWITVFPQNELDLFLQGLSKIFYHNLSEESAGLLKLFKLLIPDGKISLTFYDKEDWYNTFLVEINPTLEILNIQVRKPNEFGHFNQYPLYRYRKIIKNISNRYSGEVFNINTNFLVSWSALVSILRDLIESDLPLNKNRKNFLIQRFFDFLSNVEKDWDFEPKSFFYKQGWRFFLRILGYHINPRKWSHWAIPDILSLLNIRSTGAKKTSAYLLFSVPNKEVKNASMSERLINSEKVLILTSSENNELKWVKIIDDIPPLKDTFKRIELSNNALLINELKTYLTLYENDSKIIGIIDKYETNSDPKLLNKIKKSLERKRNIIEFRLLIKKIYHEFNMENKWDLIDRIDKLIVFNTDNLKFLLKTSIFNGGKLSIKEFIPFMKNLSAMKKFNNFVEFPESIQYQTIMNTKDSVLIKKVFRVLFDNIEF